jgi:hypothetical protein
VLTPILKSRLTLRPKAAVSVFAILTRGPLQIVLDVSALDKFKSTKVGLAPEWIF